MASFASSVTTCGARLDQLKNLKKLKKKKGKAAAIFKLKEDIVGEKKAPMEAVVMKHPTTNEMLFQPS